MEQNPIRELLNVPWPSLLLLARLFFSHFVWSLPFFANKYVNSNTQYNSPTNSARFIFANFRPRMIPLFGGKQLIFDDTAFSGGSSSTAAPAFYWDYLI